MFSVQLGDVRKVSLWHPPDLCGVLEKQVRKGGGWHPRYFVLKGSNLFWFKNPTAKKPKGNVPLEGASIHAVRPPALSAYSQAMYEQDASGLPALFGIVVLLDDQYALSPGGRSELVIAASTADLQSLWVRALEQASIPRPELLARLQEHSKLTEGGMGVPVDGPLDYSEQEQQYVITTALDHHGVPLPNMEDVQAHIHPTPSMTSLQRGQGSPRTSALHMPESGAHGPVSPRASGYQKSRLSRASSPEPRGSFHFPDVAGATREITVAGGAFGDMSTPVKVASAAEYQPAPAQSFVYNQPAVFDVGAAKQSMAAAAMHKQSQLSQQRHSLSPLKARTESLLSGIRTLLPGKPTDTYGAQQEFSLGAYYPGEQVADMYSDGMRPARQHVAASGVSRGTHSSGRNSAAHSDPTSPRRATINIRSAAASDAWNGLTPTLDPGVGYHSPSSPGRSASPSWAVGANAWGDSPRSDMRRSMSPSVPVRAQALSTSARSSGARSVAPTAPAGAVGGTLVHDIVGNWAAYGQQQAEAGWPMSAEGGVPGDFSSQVRQSQVPSYHSYDGMAQGGVRGSPQASSASAAWQHHAAPMSVPEMFSDTAYRPGSVAYSQGPVDLPAVPQHAEGPFSPAATSPRAESVASVELAARDAALATLANVQQAARDTTLASIAAVQKRAARESALASTAALREQSARETAMASIAAVHRQLARESALMSIASVQQQVAHAAELLAQQADRLQSGAPIDSLTDEAVINSLPMSPRPGSIASGGVLQEEPTPDPAPTSTPLPTTRGTRANSDFFVSAFSSLQASLETVQLTLNNLVHTAAESGSPDTQPSPVDGRLSQEPANPVSPAFSDAPTEPSFAWGMPGTEQPDAPTKATRATSTSTLQGARASSIAHATPLVNAAQQLHACLGMLQQPGAQLRAPEVQALTAELAAVHSALQGLDAQMSARGSAVYAPGTLQDSSEEFAWSGPTGARRQSSASMLPRQSTLNSTRQSTLMSGAGGSAAYQDRPVGSNSFTSPRASAANVRQSAAFSRGAASSYVPQEHTPPRQSSLQQRPSAAAAARESTAAATPAAARGPSLHALHPALVPVEDLEPQEMPSLHGGGSTWEDSVAEAQLPRASRVSSNAAARLSMRTSRVSSTMRDPAGQSWEAFQSDGGGWDAPQTAQPAAQENGNGFQGQSRISGHFDIELPAYPASQRAPSIALSQSEDLARTSQLHSRSSVLSSAEPLPRMSRASVANRGTAPVDGMYDNQGAGRDRGSSQLHVARNTASSSWQPVAPFSWEEQQAGTGGARLSASQSQSRISAWAGESSAIRDSTLASRASQASFAGAGAQGNTGLSSNTNSAWQQQRPSAADLDQSNGEGWSLPGLRSSSIVGGGSSGDGVWDARKSALGPQEAHSWGLQDTPAQRQSRASSGLAGLRSVSPDAATTNIQPAAHPYDVPFSNIASQRPTRTASTAAASSGWVDVGAAARRASLLSSASAVDAGQFCVGTDAGVAFPSLESRDSVLGSGLARWDDQPQQPRSSTLGSGASLGASRRSVLSSADPSQVPASPRLSSLAEETWLHRSDGGTQPSTTYDTFAQFDSTMNGVSASYGVGRMSTLQGGQGVQAGRGRPSYIPPTDSTEVSPRDEGEWVGFSAVTPRDGDGDSFASGRMSSVQQGHSTRQSELFRAPEPGWGYNAGRKSSELLDLMAEQPGAEQRRARYSSTDWC